MTTAALRAATLRAATLCDVELTPSDLVEAPAPTSATIARLVPDRPAASPLIKAPAELSVADSHLVERNGHKYAGTHLLIDIWDASGLDDLQHVDRTLRCAVEAAGATLLRLDLHHFTENNGISGVALLAESHISIHTWPECGYAALDVFMCGTCDPRLAIPAIEDGFRPGRTEVTEQMRGKMS